MVDLFELKAREIDVPQAAPFEHDCLDRQEEVANLTRLLRHVATPFVLAINGPWGQGKSTFIRMLQAALVDTEVSTVLYNAWVTDFVEHPLLAFLGEVTRALKRDGELMPQKKVTWQDTLNVSKHLLKRSVPALVKVGTLGAVDLDEAYEIVASELAGALSQDAIEQYCGDVDHIAHFKLNMREVLMRDDGSVQKLVIFIDELDRCKPTYAVALLERIKHLLDIEGLVFVLALDRVQLTHSVKAVYGQDFDANGHLRRFFDLAFDLRNEGLDAFIDHLYVAFGLDTFFHSRANDRHAQFDGDDLKRVFSALSEHIAFSLRDVEQLFAKINVVRLAMRENEPLILCC